MVAETMTVAERMTARDGAVNVHIRRIVDSGAGGSPEVVGREAAGDRGVNGVADGRDQDIEIEHPRVSLVPSPETGPSLIAVRRRGRQMELHPPKRARVAQMVATKQMVTKRREQVPQLVPAQFRHLGRHRREKQPVQQRQPQRLHH